MTGGFDGVPPERGRERPDGIVVVVEGEAQLLHVVGALGAAGRLAGRLDGGQEQGDQDGDDRDDDQQLDQREAGRVASETTGNAGGASERSSWHAPRMGEERWTKTKATKAKSRQSNGRRSRPMRHDVPDGTLSQVKKIPQQYFISSSCPTIGCGLILRVSWRKTGPRIRPPNVALQPKRNDRHELTERFGAGEPRRLNGQAATWRGRRHRGLAGRSVGHVPSAVSALSKANPSEQRRAPKLAAFFRPGLSQGTAPGSGKEPGGTNPGAARPRGSFGPSEQPAHGMAFEVAPLRCAAEGRRMRM